MEDDKQQWIMPARAVETRALPYRCRRNAPVVEVKAGVGELLSRTDSSPLLHRGGEGWTRHRRKFTYKDDAFAKRIIIFHE